MAPRAPRFAPAGVDLERRADGSVVLRSPQALGPTARALGEWLVQWAARAPDRTFLAERAGDGWRKLTYKEVLEAARRVGQALLDRGLGAERPVTILSDNGIDHALLALGAMHVGIPVAPVSPAYSLMSKDFAKLKSIIELLRPGLVYCSDPARFAPALAAVGATATPIAALLEPAPTARVDEAFARDRTGHDREDPLHLRLDRHAEGRRQHPPHALLEPADGGAGVAVPRGPAAGARRLAALEPHVRRQLLLQHDPAERRHAPHRRRQAGARARRDHRAEPEGDLADRVLQRPARLRPAAAVPRARRGAAGELLPRSRVRLLRRRGAPAEPLGAAREGRRRGRRRAGDDLGVGLDRDGARSPPRCTGTSTAPASSGSRCPAAS